MKRHFTIIPLAVAALHAGTPSPEISSASDAPWIKPVIDIRARYEIADADGFDVSHALTTRARLGLKTKEWHGFSAFIEGEFTQAIIDDYNAGGGGDPLDPANTPINDPETNELNQAYLQYSGHGAVLKLGRQRIIYDNAAFIGNVGWRQNEQTYDAISLTNTSIEGFALNFAWIDQVNRIFGSEAAGPFRNLESEIFLFNASYTGIPGITLGGYVYLMDFEDEAPAMQSSGLDNDTYGIIAKGSFAGIALHGELAWQEKAGHLNDRSGFYTHLTATKTFGDQSLTVGFEHLDAGVQTPLATLHAFNGFADALVAARLTGNATQVGITDLYVSHTMPICWGIKWTNVAHIYGDNGIGTDLGYEFDSVLAKKFDDHFTAILKIAHFESESPLFPTTTRASIELNYTF